MVERQRLGTAHRPDDSEELEAALESADPVVVAPVAVARPVWEAAAMAVARRGAVGQRASQEDGSPRLLEASVLGLGRSSAGECIQRMKSVLWDGRTKCLGCWRP